MKLLTLSLIIINKDFEEFKRDRQLQDEFGNKVRNVLTDLWQLVEETQVMKAGKLLKDKNNGAVYVQSYLILHNPL